MQQKIKKVFFYGMWLAKFSFLMVVFLIVSLPLRFSKKYKNLWLISERPDEARDNGYWLYKWILENKPETNVRYVLDRKSADYEKVPHKELIVQPGSAKHYILYILSSYSVSTHMHGACPGKSFCIPFLFLMRKKKTVFLQHGITQNRIKLRGGLDVIAVSTKNELEPLLFSNPKYKNKAYVVGFCRYDHLIDVSSKEKEKIILVMPTFRRWLRDIGRLKNANQVFKDTEYFKKWNSFLNNRKLAEALEKNRIKLIFFPHKEMQELAKNFKCKSKRVEIGHPGEYDIQELLKKSSLLITDYSSVLFDFVYMNKPIELYQFDQGDFFSRHYISSGSEYPFGDIFKIEDDLVEEVISRANHGFAMKEKYANDADKFFGFRDKKNCERNFNMIKRL